MTWQGDLRDQILRQEAVPAEAAEAAFAMRSGTDVSAGISAVLWLCVSITSYKRPILSARLFDTEQCQEPHHTRQRDGEEGCRFHSGSLYQAVLFRVLPIAVDATVSMACRARCIISLLVPVLTPFSATP